jgi:hypothetical protein
MKIDQGIVLSKISPLENAGLLDYMAEQSIPAEVCQKYLQQIKLYNKKTKKHFLALGMTNDDKGFELQNQHYSGWINVEDDDGERDISFIRGRKHPSRSLHVFWHMNDFLAKVAREKEHAFIGDVIILHSFDLLDVIPECLYLFGYKRLISWMPNNDYGKTAIDTLDAFCLAQPGCEHSPRNRFFAKYETIREWCAAQPAIITG